MKLEAENNLVWRTRVFVQHLSANDGRHVLVLPVARLSVVVGISSSSCTRDFPGNECSILQVTDFLQFAVR
jgi:hypothetical protein